MLECRGSYSWAKIHGWFFLCSLVSTDCIRLCLGRGHGFLVFYTKCLWCSNIKMITWRTYSRESFAWCWSILRSFYWSSRLLIICIRKFKEIGRTTLLKLRRSKPFRISLSRFRNCNWLQLLLKCLLCSFLHVHVPTHRS